MIMIITVQSDHILDDSLCR